MRRVPALAVVVAAAFILAADGHPRAVKDGGTFKVGVTASFIRTIDPALVGLPLEGRVLWPACESLVAYPAKPPPAGLQLVPELAEAMPVVSAGGKTYTFSIRKDARFSTGAPVTAQAVLREIERAIDPGLGNNTDLASLIVGGEDVLAGKASAPSGGIARGRTLTIKLTRRDPAFLSDYGTTLCAVPPTLQSDPEGAKAPLPSPAPYYVSVYVPGQRIVLSRNPYYKGPRPHHVDRFTVDVALDEGSIVDEIASGQLDWGGVTVDTWAARSKELAKRYGVNKSQFFVKPGLFLRMFVLNTSRPLFRNNPKLRQAVNLAVDRKALTDAFGPYGGKATDQYLQQRDDDIYPLRGPDLKRAQALARGHTRSGKAVLYTRPDPVDLATAQILQRNLRAIGIELEVVAEFPGPLIFQALAEGQQKFDFGRLALGNDDSSMLSTMFDGRTIGTDMNGNWSYFNSPKVNRLLDEASHLTGAARYRALAGLDRLISRDFAPAVPYARLSAIEFVSKRTGCVVLAPFLDLSAVCLK